MILRIVLGLSFALPVLMLGMLAAQEKPGSAGQLASPATAGYQSQVAGVVGPVTSSHAHTVDYFALMFVFMLATFIGLGVVARVSRLLHTPLMSLTNAISGIAVVGSIIVAGGDYPLSIRLLGVVALFASMTNVVSGFLITDRMLKMFKQPGGERKS